MSKELMIILAATWQTIFWRFRDHHPLLVPGSYSLVKFSYSISIHSSGSSSTGIVYISPLLWLCFDVNFRVCIFLLHLSSFTSDFFRCQFDYFHCFSFAFFFTTVIHKYICTLLTRTPFSQRFEYVTVDDDFLSPIRHTVSDPSSRFNRLTSYIPCSLGVSPLP